MPTPTHRTSGRRPAQAAAVLGMLYAALSVYWALGGTGLLDTIGGTLAEAGRAGTTDVLLAVWAAVILKTIAALLPLQAMRRHGRPGHARALRLLAWTTATILTGYGLVLTTAGLLTQTGIVHTPATADHHALAWHAYLWDPWFLLWGLLAATALLRSRPHPSPTTTKPESTSITRGQM